MKVVVVENNLELLKLLTHLLEKEGFTVFRATSGSEALARHAEHKPAIICLDIILDDISGFDVCRRIRAEDKGVQIILITSKSRQSDIDTGMAAGADDYIIKPFDLADITRRMRNIARKIIARDPSAKPAESFPFGSLTIYPEKLSAELDGKNIDLSLRDVGFLKVFYLNKGKTLSLQNLLPYCWQSPAMSADAVVEWHIRELRKKIGDDPASPALIRAHESGGYSFG